MPTPAVILQNAPVACYLAANKIEKSKKKNGGFLDIDLDKKIYIVYKILKKIYDLNPAYTGIVGVANYLWELCGEFGVAALGITGGSGGSVVPVSGGGTGGNAFNFDYVREVHGLVPDFANATDYNDVAFSGHNLLVFWNDIPRFLNGGTEWAYTVGGVRILIDGFDATANNYFFVIFIKDPLGTSGSTTTEVTRSFEYDGLGGEVTFYNTLLDGATIIEVFRGTPYTKIFTGTPTGLEVLIGLNGANLCNGNITFAADNPISLDEVVHVDFSKAIGGAPVSSETFLIE